MSKLYTLLCLALLCSTSCVSKNTDLSNHELPAFEGDNILIIPPIYKDKNTSHIIGRSLTSSLLREVSSDVRYAGDIPKLNSALNDSNLISDGQVNMTEISHIGSAVNSKEVICVRVTSYSSYPPLSISCVVISRSLEGNKYKQKVSYLDINMRDIENKKEFAEYVGGSLRGALDDRFIKKTNVHAEAALLSAHEFNRYVGYKLSKNILHMKKY